ncbi:hypothetical protein SNE26_16875 [Mucilaginibacter sp. cycad4]|nr:hypothetical protein [Mucilaginibacter gossypii]WPU97701.1 hypothetical protein SNE26_16875 [Mucilaginibacter gossypii]
MQQYHTLKQVFIITDHQGNARVSFEDNRSGQARFATTAPYSLSIKQTA